MNRIEETFLRLKNMGRTGLIAFSTVGHPSVDSNVKLIPGMVAAGVDIVELGMPFSDPLADGATIQASSFHSLKQQTNLGTCLEVAEAVRRACPETPIILMGYYNPIFTFGIEAFVKGAKEAGVDGVIVPDLPPEESAPLADALTKQCLDLIYLLAPTSPLSRVRKIASMARGFIYCVSVAGITGARGELPGGLEQFISRVRGETSLPLAVGFGVSTPGQVRTIGQYAEAVVMGSVFIDLLNRTSPDRYEQELQTFIAGFVADGR